MKTTLCTVCRLNGDVLMLCYNYCALMVCRSNSDVLMLWYSYCALMFCRSKSDVLMLCYNFVPSWSAGQRVMS